MEIKLVKTLDANEYWEMEIKGQKGLSFVRIFQSDAENILKQQSIVESEIVQVTPGNNVRVYKLL